MQVIVGRWPLHWTIKFPLVVVVSMAVLFASYHYMVRSTFIGKFLNGRRYPRRTGGDGIGAAAGAQAILDSSR